MRSIVRTLAVAMTMALTATIPATAQGVVTTITIEDIKASCLVGGSDEACLAAVRAYIAELKTAGLAPDVVDDMIAQIAVELGANASGLPPEVRARVAEAITVAAAEISDSALADRLVVAAADVAAGVDVAPGAVDASPA